MDYSNFYNATPEQVKRIQERLDKDRAKALRRIERKQSILGFIRPVVYTPLSILFRALSVIVRALGWVASLGLIAGFYYAYKVISAIANGASFRQVDGVLNAVVFLAAPFAIYAVAELTERIYLYFDENRF